MQMKVQFRRPKSLMSMIRSHIETLFLSPLISIPYYFLSNFYLTTSTGDFFVLVHLTVYFLTAIISPS